MVKGGLKENSFYILTDINYVPLELWFVKSLKEESVILYNITTNIQLDETNAYHTWKNNDFEYLIEL